jgi:hypothetical protein
MYYLYGAGSVDFVIMLRTQRAIFLVEFHSLNELIFNLLVCSSKQLKRNAYGIYKDLQEKSNTVACHASGQSPSDFYFINWGHGHITYSYLSHEPIARKQPTRNRLEPFHVFNVSHGVS